MPTPPAPPCARWSDARAGRGLRAGAGVALALGAAMLAWATHARPGMDLQAVVPETYIRLEFAQSLVWIGAVAACALAAARAPTRRIALLAAWLGAVGLAAGLREVDLHVLLNPANIHLLGLAPEQAVRFRLDWWTDRTVSAPLKLAWAGVLLLLPAAILVPFALARHPWVRRLLDRDAFTWLIAAGLGTLACGYALDDLLRFVAWEHLSLAEEIAELIGPGLLLGAAGLLALGRDGSARRA